MSSLVEKFNIGHRLKVSLLSQILNFCLLNRIITILQRFIH